MKLKDALYSGYTLVEFEGLKVESVHIDEQYRVIQISSYDRSGFTYLGDDIEVKDIIDRAKLVMLVNYDEDLLAALKLSGVAPVLDSHINKGVNLVTRGRSRGRPGSSSAAKKATRLDPSFLSDCDQHLL